MAYRNHAGHAATLEALKAGAFARTLFDAANGDRVEVTSAWVHVKPANTPKKEVIAALLRYRPAGFESDPSAGFRFNSAPDRRCYQFRAPAQMSARNRDKADFEGMLSNHHARSAYAMNLTRH